MERKKSFIYIGVLIALLGIILSNTYRPYIYQKQLFDFHIADTIGSLLSVPAATFFFRGISQEHSFYKFILISTLAFVIYEFLGLLKIKGVFDIYDILAIFIGALITFFVGLWFKIDKTTYS